MFVVLALAGLAVLGGVVVLAKGRGGELSAASPDRPPLPRGDEQLVAALESARLRLPRGLWGYQSEVADEVVYRLVGLLAEREARVAELEWRLAERRLPTPPEAVRPDGDGQVPFEDELFAEHEAAEAPAEAEHEAETSTEPERRGAQPVGLVKAREAAEEPEEYR